MPSQIPQPVDLLEIGDEKSLSRHPLEPLSAAEVTTAVEILKTHPIFTPATRIVSVTLREPDKTKVFLWPEKASDERHSLAVLVDNGINAAYTVTLELTKSVVIQVEKAPAGSQPTLSMDEQFECEQAVLASPEFHAKLKEHYGVTDPSLVMVDIWSAGNYGAEEDRTHRLARPLCFLRSDPTENGYARPLEGLRPVVDLNTMQVLRVEDYGCWPLPPQPGNYAADRVVPQRLAAKPLMITQPEGPGFQLTGQQLKWENWEFVVGFNGREGLTIHHVRYHDHGRARSILYRGSLTEMVVPYGDPRPTQARKNAFDVGEYGMGYCTNSLTLGCDCVGQIAYLDADLCTSRGDALKIPNAICIHEEGLRDPMEAH